MRLDYLLFDATDGQSGSCSFDALASVLPDRLPALMREVEAVLAWAHRAFGAPAPGMDEGEWDFALQAAEEPGGALQVRYEGAPARVRLPQPPQGRVTISLTVTGSRAFAAAFREAFPEDA
ncbi:MAG: hypothetical protein ACO1PB_16865 [Ramlibacter sp.]